MTRRAQAKLFCVAVCCVSAILCGLNHALVVATTQLVAAVIVWRVGFGRIVGAAEMNDFAATLREARAESRVRDATIQATVFPMAITAAFTERRMRFVPATSIVFRDELSLSLWREVSVRLRHQSHPAPQTK